MRWRREQLGQARGRPQPSQARWAAAGLLLAVAGSLVVLLAPLGVQGEECASSPSGSSVQIGVCKPIVTRRSMVSEEGWRVAMPLSVPVALAGAGAWGARRRLRPLLVAVAVLLGVLVFLSVLSVGIYYLPAEVAIIVATVKASP